MRTFQRLQLFLVASTAALSGCAPAAPAAAPPRPPPPPATTAASSPPPGQVFADADADYTFTDLHRRDKLASGFAALDAMVDADLQEHGVPGIAVGVVVDGELSHVHGAGVADLRTKVVPDADTVFRIGSITKSFTGLAILALRDEGVLGLDDPLARIVPEAAGLTYPTRDSPPLTLRQLLTHTSGLPRLGDFNYTRPDSEPSEQEILHSLTGFPVQNAPGTVGVYSNLGFGLLGIAVGKAAHVPLRTFMAKRIFAPLGMTSTAFDPSALPAGRLATGYEKGLLGRLAPAPPWRLGASEGAGGIYSTVRDMARYVAFQLDAYPPRSAPEAGPVRRSSVREAHESAVHHGRFAVQLRDAPAKGESFVTAYSALYGYGWVREESCEFEERIWHNGAVDGFTAAVSFLPRHGVGVVVLANRGGVGLDPYDPASLAARMLLALKKTGGLSPRVRRAVLPPAFAPALARLLAVYETWNEDAYKAMLSPDRPPNLTESERRELAGYHALHGTCTGYEPIEVMNLRAARLALRCERGALAMELSIDSKGLITGFSGTSREVPPPPAVALAAGRLAGLVGTWDEGVYRKLFEPTPGQTKAERTAFFAGLRASHGACTVEGYTRTEETETFSLSCQRGGDLALVVKTDQKDQARVASFSITPRSSQEACPVSPVH